MRSQTYAALLLILLAACGGKAASDRASVPDSAAAPAEHRKPELSAMPMLPGLRAHLDSVAANPSMMRGEMSSHQAEVKAVVEAIRADMMAAGMHSDAAYEALADSVVKGSEALGTASGPDFNRLVAEHVDQMRRLAAVYESKAAAM